MGTYTATTNFANKDTLPSGSSDKIIKGAEFTAEFTSISTAINDNASAITTNAANITAANLSLDTKLSKTGGTVTGDLNVTGSLTLGSPLEVQDFAASKIILTDGDNVDERQGGQLWAVGNGLRYYAYDWNNILEVYTSGNHLWYNDHPDDSPTVAMKLNSTGILDVSGGLSIGGASVTATVTELNYVGGVTSSIQDQLDALSLSGSYVSTTDADYVKLTEITLTSAQINALWSRINDLESRVLDLEEGGL